MQLGSFIGMLNIFIDIVIILAIFKFKKDIWNRDKEFFEILAQQDAIISKLVEIEQIQNNYITKEIAQNIKEGKYTRKDNE